MAGGLEEASGLAWGVLQNQRFFGVPVSLLFPTPSGFPGGSTGKESACNVRDLGSIPGLGRSPGEGNGYALQCSGLENSLDCTVPGVTKSQILLSNFHVSYSSIKLKGKKKIKPHIILI